MKLAVFDFDSTLMDGETIDALASAYGVNDEVSAITRRAMAGELDFYESLKKRVSKLAGMSESAAIKVCKNLPLMPGAVEVVAGLKEKGFKVVCFSGGFRLATAHFARVLNLDAEFANILHAKDGVLTGEVGGEMMFSNSKGRMIENLQRLLGVSVNDTLVCGDGANDLSMFPFAATKIAFCAKEILKASANVVIEKKDLREILRFV